MTKDKGVLVNIIKICQVLNIKVEDLINYIPPSEITP